MEKGGSHVSSIGPRDTVQGILRALRQSSSVVERMDGGTDGGLFAAEPQGRAEFAGQPEAPRSVLVEHQTCHCRIQRYLR